MDLSYWERTSWFSNIDFTIVGSGIVGLNCALELRRQHPKAHILILEKGKLPQGASTRMLVLPVLAVFQKSYRTLKHIQN